MCPIFENCQIIEQRQSGRILQCGFNTPKLQITRPPQWKIGFSERAHRNSGQNDQPVPLGLDKQLNAQVVWDFMRLNEGLETQQQQQAKPDAKKSSGE
jgi:hypothetical protein